MAKEFFDAIEHYFRNIIDEDTKRRLDQIARLQTNEFGVDQFGFDAHTISAMAPLMVWLYRNYFRCETLGAENIPAGRMMVVGNHSGQLPFDAMMIITAFILEPEPPRYLRGMVERWTAEIPFFSTLMSRAGQVVGSPSTCQNYWSKMRA